MGCVVDKVVLEPDRPN